MIKAKDKRLFSLIKELFRIVAGPNSEAIVLILFQKKRVNEFKIANKLGITINQTRNLLYKLSNFNIISSTRKKDKRKGWYTYFWTIDNIKALNVLKAIKTKEIQSLHQLLKSREMKNFYVCPTDNIEMSEETAMHHNFLCLECGRLLEPVPKEKKIKEITTKIAQIKKELNVIREELIRITPKPKLEKVKKKAKKKRKKIKKEKGKIKKKPKEKVMKKVMKKKIKKKKVKKKTKKAKKKGKKKAKKKVKKSKKVKKVKKIKRRKPRKKKVKKIKNGKKRKTSKKKKEGKKSKGRKKKGEKKKEEKEKR